MQDFIFLKVKVENSLSPGRDPNLVNQFQVVTLKIICIQVTLCILSRLYLYL